MEDALLYRVWTSWRSTSSHVTSAPWVNKGGPRWIQNQTSIKVHHRSSLLDLKGFKNPRLDSRFIIGSQEWNCHACPKDCTHHQLARSKDPCEGGQLGKEKGSWSPWDPTKKTNNEPCCWSDSGSIMDPVCLPKERKSHDWKCYIRRSKPYIKRASSMALQLADDNPQNIQKWRTLFNRLRFLTLPKDCPIIIVYST